MIFANNTFADTHIVTPTLWAVQEKDGFWITIEDIDLGQIYEIWWEDYKVVFDRVPSYLPVPWLIEEELDKLNELYKALWQERISASEVERREEAYALELEAEEMRLMGL